MAPLGSKVIRGCPLMIANWILDEPNRALGARRVVAFERTRERRGQRRVITEYVVKNALTMRPV